MSAEDIIKLKFDQIYIVAQKKKDQQSPDVTDKVEDGSVWFVVEDV